MKSRFGLIMTATSLLIAAFVCGDGLQPATEREVPDESEKQPANAMERERGDRLLGIDVNEGDKGGYDQAFSTALDLGVDFVSLTVYWDDFETAPGIYSPDINWLDIANSYYSAAGVKVALVIAPIDTNVLHVPDDLSAVPFDDPEMMMRFQAFIDYALGQLNSVELVSISIGNEIDAYLGSDLELWNSYRLFYEKAVDHIHSINPAYKVGVKSMYNGLTNDHQEQLRKMNAHSDIILTTYYPLRPDYSVRPPDTVFEDFDLVLSFYPDKPIYFLELGYPSSQVLGSSEGDQAKFVENVFEAWDLYSKNIAAINFTWLHDISPAEVDNLASYYGIHDVKFLAYLGSLGLRHADGTEKQAFIRLEQETAARDW